MPHPLLPPAARNGTITLTVQADRRTRGTEGDSTFKVARTFAPTRLEVHLPATLEVHPDIGGQLETRHIDAAALALDLPALTAHIQLWQASLRDGSSLPVGAERALGDDRPDKVTAPDLKRQRRHQWFDAAGNWHGGLEPEFGGDGSVDGWYPKSAAYRQFEYRVNPGHLPTDWLVWLQVRAAATTRQATEVRAASERARSAASTARFISNYHVPTGSREEALACWIAAALGHDPALIRTAAAGGGHTITGPKGLTVAALTARARR
jgi:hypothetical protein